MKRPSRISDDPIERILGNWVSYISLVKKRKIPALSVLQQKRPNWFDKFWTYEECLADAAKYQNKSKWERASGGAHAAAKRKGWMEDCCKHMKPPLLPIWNLEKCLKDAKKYKSRTEWMNCGNSAYAAAQRNGWLDKCCVHMNTIKRRKLDHSFAVNSLRGVSSRDELRKKDPSLYSWFYRNPEHKKTLDEHFPEWRPNRITLEKAIKAVENKLFKGEFKNRCDFYECWEARVIKKSDKELWIKYLSKVPKLK